MDAIGVMPVVVIDSVETAGLSTSVWVWAERLIPRVAGEAIGIGTLRVSPSPVGVEGDGFGLALAATGLGAGGEVHLWEVVGLLVVNKLCR